MRSPVLLALVLVLGGCRSRSANVVELAAWNEAGGAASASAASTGRLLSLGEQVGDDAVLPIDGGIVDVNSVVHVRIAKDALETAVPPEWNAEFPPERLAALKRLSEAVRDGHANLEPLRVALAAWAVDHDSTRLQAAFTASARAFDVVAEELESRPEQRARFNAELEQLLERDPDVSQVEQDVLALRLAGELVEEEQRAWRGFLERNGVFFQLGAWLMAAGQPTPIHLPGFDDYPEQEHYEVARWSINFDAAQQAEFEAIQKTARELNEQMAQPGDVFDAYRDALRAALKKALDDCRKELEEDLERLSKQAIADAGLDAAVDVLLERLRAFADHLRELKARYGTFDADAPAQAIALLGGLEQDVRDVVDGARGIQEAADELVGKLEAANLEDAVGALVAELAAEVEKDCLGAIHKDLAVILEALGLDLAASELNDELLAFTDQVLRHTLDSLPAKTSFDLCTSGRREAGDRVVLKLAVGRARPAEDGGAPKLERLVLESRRLTLHRVLPHLATAVGLIWANPSDSTALSRDYQAAAAYSILYKWGSRESETFNSLWSPGIGLSLAALDFDKDDDPELGVAGVLSLVRDYIQVGYGYDPSAESAYWFFGFSLPLPMWTLPGQGIDTEEP